MNKRSQAMAALYKQGATLHEIGVRYGITRERVRQILSDDHGFTKLNGGKHIKTSRLRAAAMAKKDAAYREKYGVSYAEWCSMGSKLRRAYRRQKISAMWRGIEFKLSMLDFISVWRDSGCLSDRGRGKDKFCMSRINDAGAYEIGNVQIITNAENARLYRLSTKGTKRRPVDRQGVSKLYPGYKKPYVAYYKQRNLGYFATEDEAYEARRRALVAA